jgi:hypothetical protein
MAFCQFHPESRDFVLQSDQAATHLEDDIDSFV